MIVAGQLYLFNHSKDVACPSVQAIYTPGDIIGISEISNGWTRQQHDWIVANNDCDIFVCSREYVSYLWHIMKRGMQKDVVALLHNNPTMKKLSEQTLFSIAYDMAEFKEYEEGETIVHQDRKSHYNLHFLKSNFDAMRNLRLKDKDYELSQKLTQRCNYPTLKQAWDEQEVKRNWDAYITKKKKDEELAKANGILVKKRNPVKKQDEVLYED